MKRKILFALATTLLATSCMPLSGTEKELRARIAAAQSEDTLCPKFTESHQMAIKATRSFAKAYPDRDAALAALSLLEARPLEYPKSRSAALYFSAHEEELLSSINRLANFAIATTIPYECENFLAMQALPMLNQAARALSLSSKDQARIRAVTTQFLWDRVPDGRIGIIFYAVQARVLEAYLENGYQGTDRADLLKKARALTESFEAGRKALFHPISKLEGIVDAYTLKRTRAEMKFKHEFAARYEALLQRVLPKPAEA